MGCIDVTDCLSQEEYAAKVRKSIIFFSFEILIKQMIFLLFNLFSSIDFLQHTDEDNESVSPYVFICENPQSLIVKFPIKGDHKICEFSFYYNALFVCS